MILEVFSNLNDSVIRSPWSLQCCRSCVLALGSGRSWAVFPACPEGPNAGAGRVEAEGRLWARCCAVWMS